MNKILRQTGYLFLFIVIQLTFKEFASAQKSAGTEIMYLSGSDRMNARDWDFYCTDGMNSGQWTKIPVPSQWELQGFGTYNYGHDQKNPEIPYGKEKGLYKYEFTVPKKWEGKVINIVFDGVMTDAKVKVNGEIAGDVHQGAFYRFKYDISDLINYDETNLLEVEVSKFSSNESVNKAERYADYWIFGGIFRPVYLEALPEYHIERIAVDARADGNLTAHLYVNKVKNDMEVELELYDAERNKIAETKFFPVDISNGYTLIKTAFDNVKNWNPEYPDLYTLKIILKRKDEVLHEIEEKIGFRTVKLIPNDGIYVNGKKILLKGVNRHSFRPESGRCLAEEDHIADVDLIKGMNMNAVRMSHYPPDERFLEICDSAGLFVLDELAGWQQGYDTVVGPKLIREMIIKDENHPSVIVWNNGNEGGWEFANEKWFHFYDIQKRPVIYPWLLRNDVDSRHYPDYDLIHSRFLEGNEIFFPTELLHGLYDGGHGAGLDDYWNAFRANPVFSGGFLWNLRDEAVWRTDLGIYDSDGNHAPDGIVGPHGEKEGSFYTIKEIWSAVQAEPFLINEYFDGKIILKNEFIYTNLIDCKFSWEILKAGNPKLPQANVLFSGEPESPDIPPGESGRLNLDLPENYDKGDILRLKAYDPYHKEIYSQTWPIHAPEKIIRDLLASKDKGSNKLKYETTSDDISVTAGDLSFTFSTKTGTLSNIRNNKGIISFNGGPVPVGNSGKLTDVEWQEDEEGNFVIKVGYEEFPKYFKWKLHKNGLLYLEVAGVNSNMNDVDFAGVSFNYPEELCKGISWFGKGPYRVYKNRMKGVGYGVWKKDYNNTITGESYDSLLYPEFKGYHANLIWAELHSEESDFRIYCESPDIFMKLFTPANPAAPGNGAYCTYPEGDISFLYCIPAIGTKFHKPENLGPSSRRINTRYRTDDQLEPIKLWFDFNSN